MRATKTTCWKCSSCGKVFIDRGLAEKCCVCRACGKEGVRTLYAGDQCGECSECGIGILPQHGCWHDYGAAEKWNRRVEWWQRIVNELLAGDGATGGCYGA